MSRIAFDRWLVADKNLDIFPANQAIFVEIGNVYGLNPNIRDGQIVIYNADTFVSVGAGVTASTCPNLGIAQGVQTKDGMVLRKAPFEKVAATSLNAVTAEPPECGQVKIIDVGIGCMERGNSFSMTIEARDEQTERFYNYRDYERWTETVEFDFDPCEGCEQSLECKEVACALVNKFNGKDRDYSLKDNISLIRRVRQHQDKDRPFHVYVLHPYDYQFCFTTADAACVGCNTISAITGITIGEGEDEVTTTFVGTTDPADDTLSRVSDVDKIIKQINDALGDKGYALNASTFTGTAKPCCDGVKILINACVPVVLLGDEATPITPCDTGLPTHTVTKQGHCGSCGTSTTVTPCAFIRVVAKPIDINKFADRPDNWKKTLYTDINVTTSYNNNNIGLFKTFVFQDYKIPRGLVYEVAHDILRQDTSMNEPFSWGYDEFSGRYLNFTPGSRTPAMGHGIFKGCDSFDTVCIYNFEYDGVTKDTSVFAHNSDIHTRLTVVVPNTNTAFKTSFEAIINPWIASVPGKLFQSVTCASDQDQVERTLNANYTVNAAGYRNANGNIIGG
jgi:hypothetical protein